MHYSIYKLPMASVYYPKSPPGACMDFLIIRLLKLEELCLSNSDASNDINNNNHLIAKRHQSIVQINKMLPTFMLH